MNLIYLRDIFHGSVLFSAGSQQSVEIIYPSCHTGLCSWQCYVVQFRLLFYLQFGEKLHSHSFRGWQSTSGSEIM